MARIWDDFTRAGENAVTTLAHAYEELDRFQKAYDARGGQNYWLGTKFADDGNLTPEQLAHNANMDKLAENALEMAVLGNEMRDWISTRLGLVYEHRNDI